MNKLVGALGILALSSVTGGLCFYAGMRYGEKKVYERAEAEIETIRNLYFLKGKARDNEKQKEDMVAKYFENDVKATIDAYKEFEAYRIKAAEYGEFDGYTLISATMESDGTVKDENGDEVSTDILPDEGKVDPDDLDGDALYLRDDEHQIDYEIILTDEAYESIVEKDEEDDE